MLTLSTNKAKKKSTHHKNALKYTDKCITSVPSFLLKKTQLSATLKHRDSTTKTALLTTLFDLMLFYVCLLFKFC